MVEKEKLVCSGALGNSDLMFSDRLQVSRLERGQRWRLRAHQRLEHSQGGWHKANVCAPPNYGSNQSGVLRVCSQQFLCAGGVLSVETT